MLAYQPIFAVFNLLPYPSGPLYVVIDPEIIIEKVEAALTQLFSIGEGRKIVYKPSKKQRDNLRRLLKLLEENLNVRYRNLDITEQKIENFKLEFSKIVFGRRTDPFERFNQSIAKSLESPKSYSFINYTKYDSYCEALNKILKKVDSEGHYTKIAEFSKYMTPSEYLGILQDMRRINKTHLKYLDKNQDTLTEQAVRRHISIYDDLSGNLEKYVRFFVWIDQLFEGKILDYAKIKQDSLRNHVQHLRTQRVFKDLLKPLDVTIRNAISHRSLVIDPISETITFTDIKKTVTRCYRDFFNETRELAAAWSAISNFSFLIFITYHGLKLADNKFFSEFRDKRRPSPSV